MTVVAEIRDRSKYLEMPGGISGAYITLPEMTFRTISFDIMIDTTQSGTHYLVDARPGHSLGYFYSSMNGSLWNNQKVYVNGELVVANSVAELPKGQRIFLTIEAATTVTDALNIFSRYSNNETLKGRLYGLQIWDRVLTNEEVRHYQKGCGYTEDGLLAYYLFNEETGTTLNDLTGNGRHGTIGGSGFSWGRDKKNHDLLIRERISAGTHVERFDYDTIGAFPKQLTKDAGNPYVDIEPSSGKKTLYFPGNGVYHRVRTGMQIPLTPGEVIEATATYKGDVGARCYFGIVFNVNGYTYFNNFPQGTHTSGAWRTFTGTLTVPANVTHGWLWIFNYDGNTGPMWVEEVRFKHNRKAFEMFPGGYTDATDIVEDPRHVSSITKIGNAYNIDGTLQSCTVGRYTTSVNVGGSWTAHAVPQPGEYTEVAEVTDGIEGPKVFRISGGTDWKAFTGASFNYQAGKWYRVSVYTRITEGLGSKSAQCYLPYFGTSANANNWRSFTAGQMADGQWKRLYNIQLMNENKVGNMYLYGHGGTGTIEYASLMIEEFDSEPTGPPPPLEEGMHIGQDGTLYLVGGEFVEGVKL